MLTLEERERVAYITNAPEHPLVLLALEGDEDRVAEIADLTKEANEAENRITTQSGQIEDLEIQVGDLQEKVEGLEQQIHDAGVDLV